MGLLSNGFNIVAANEIIHERCELYRTNFPNTQIFEGDVWKHKDSIIRHVKNSIKDKLDLIYATPPCQGMSTNGIGKLKSEIRAGNRPQEDARNKLIIPTMDIICSLKPEWILLENVPNMKNTIIEIDNEYVNILDYISKRLGVEYIGKGEIINCSEYSIPQIRKRLVTIFTRNSNGGKYFLENDQSFFPDYEKQKPKTLRDAIGSFPALDALEGKESCFSFNPFHYVPIIKPEKYWWIVNTKEGDTAYNNQCVNQNCLYQGNKLHKDNFQDGHWRSNKDTSIVCEKCDSPLPRPTIIDAKTNQRRLISGFHSAYRRMKWDEPSRTLTRNLFFEASDNKIHPDQNRVLSVYEALVIQTISEYDYSWMVKGKQVSRKQIADAIGESVPPKLIDFIAKKIMRLKNDNDVKK